MWRTPRGPGRKRSSWEISRRLLRERDDKDLRAAAELGHKYRWKSGRKLHRGVARREEEFSL